MFQKKIDTIREELASIEKEMEDIGLLRLDMQPPSKLARHGLPWSQFEKDLAKEDFNALTDKLSKRFGRTRLSIILHIQAYISGDLR